MSKLWPRARFASRLAVSAGLDLAIAGSFLITWLAPYTFGELAVHRLTFMMLVEFLVVHSTGFFAAMSGPKQGPWWMKDAERARRRATLRRVGAYVGLVLFYCLFSASFSVAYGGPWPFFAFLAVALPKFPTIVLRPPDEDGQTKLIVNWAAMTALYLGALVVTVTADVPPFGVTDDVIARQGFTLGGVWPEEPYRALAFGAAYFTGLALLSLVTETWAFGRQGEKDGAPGAI